MDDSVKIIVRDGTDEDHGFVASTWSKGIYYGNDHIGELPENVFYKWFPRILTNILRSPQTTVKIACDEKNPSWIVACAVFSERSLYWVYVRDGYRQQGIASLLLKDEGIKEVKCLMSITRPGASIAEKKGFTFVSI